MTSRVENDAAPVVFNLPLAATSVPSSAVKNDAGLFKKYEPYSFYKRPRREPNVRDNVFLFDILATPRSDVMDDFGKGYDTTSATNTQGFIPTSATPNVPIPVPVDFLKTIEPKMRKEYMKQMTLDMYYFTGVSGGNYDATIGLGQSSDNSGFPVFVRGYSTVPLEKIKPNTRDYNFCEPLCLNLSDVTGDDERSAMNTKRFNYGSCFPFTLAPFNHKDLFLSVLCSTKQYSYQRQLALAGRLDEVVNLEIGESKFLKRQFSVAKKVESGLIGLVLLICNCLGLSEREVMAKMQNVLMHYKPRSYEEEEVPSKSRTERRDGTFYETVMRGGEEEQVKAKMFGLFSMMLLDEIESIEVQKREAETELITFSSRYGGVKYSDFSQRRMGYSFSGLVDGLAEQFQLRAPVAHFMGNNNGIFDEQSIRWEGQIKY